jgi:peptidyl-prolyl cis-trans isomerase D
MRFFLIFFVHQIIKLKVKNMLQNIRDNAQGWLAWLIVIFISIPFALWGIEEYLHTTPKRMIAEVNGVELSEYDFKDQLQQRKRQLQAMIQNQNIDLSFMEQQIRQSTLKQMIDQEVLKQAAINAGLRINDALLIRNIQSFPDFQENGVFSQERYEQLLGDRAAGFERNLRLGMLTAQIREGVIRSAIFTDYEQEQYTRIKKQQRLISYLLVSRDRFKDLVSISSAEIEAHYQKYAKQYMTPEKVSIEYVELSKKDLVSADILDEETLKTYYEERKASFTKPGQWKARHILIQVAPNADIAKKEIAHKKAQEILVKIQAGESFEELAKQFSDDRGSKSKGGDLGWFGSDIMVKPFQDALKVMKVGEVSELVKSPFGFHIIKLDDVKPEVVRPFAEVRTQLAEEIQKETLESKFYGKVEELANLAYEHPEGLEVLKKSLNLDSKTTSLFGRDGNQDNPISLNPKVIVAAFSHDVLKEGFNSEPVEIGEQHVVVLRVKDHEAAKAKPLNEVKDEIILAIQQEKTQAQALALGKNLFKQIKEKGDADLVAKTQNLSWSTAQWVERNDSKFNEAEIVADAFKLRHPTKNKALYHGIQLGNGDYALVAVLSVKDGVKMRTVAEKDSQKPDVDEQAILQQEQAIGFSEFNQLLSGLRAKAEIKDYSTKISDE